MYWQPAYERTGGLFLGNGQQVAQESLLRLAGVVVDVPAEPLADLGLVRVGVGEDRINDRGYLPAQGAEIVIDVVRLAGPAGRGGPPVLGRP